MRTYRVVLFAVAFAATIGASGTAFAKQHRFVGEHPVAKHAGGGFCYIEAPHVHVYAPQRPRVMYRDYDGWQYFAGDPVAHGYDGKKHGYHGAHPIHVDVALADPDYEDDDHHVEYCYLVGPHFHDYEPFADAKFVAKADVNWYVGEFPPVFIKAKPRYMRINAVYKPIAYDRPVLVEVQPPDDYVDVLVAVPVVEIAVPTPVVDVVVEPPRVGLDVEVRIPVPSLELRFGPDGRKHGKWRGNGHRRKLRKNGHRRKLRKRKSGHGRRIRGFGF